MGLVCSHIVFALKNSRYDWQKIKRRKAVGYIAPTFSFFKSEEEDLVIKILCDIAAELELKIVALNLCGDHVHAMIIHSPNEILKLMLLWKGKSAYTFNKNNFKPDNNSEGLVTSNKQEGLWAKSYFQRIMKSPEEFQNVRRYIVNNRLKHGLPPLTKFSIDLIHHLISKNNPL
jgi:REP element-mobilizing transposase RayT